MASTVAAPAVRRATKEFHGIVVSAGKMDKTVKVKFGGLRYEPRVQKVRCRHLPPTYLPTYLPTHPPTHPPTCLPTNRPS